MPEENTPKTIEEAGWEIRGIKQRLSEGAGAMSEIRTSLSKISDLAKEETRDALREHADANRRDNDKLEMAVRGELSKLEGKIEANKPKPIIRWLVGILVSIVGGAVIIVYTAGGVTQKVAHLEEAYTGLINEVKALEADRQRRIQEAPDRWVSQKEFRLLLDRIAAIEAQLVRGKP